MPKRSFKRNAIGQFARSVGASSNSASKAKRGGPKVHVSQPAGPFAEHSKKTAQKYKLHRIAESKVKIKDLEAKLRAEPKPRGKILDTDRSGRLDDAPKRIKRKARDR